MDFPHFFIFNTFYYFSVPFNPAGGTGSVRNLRTNCGCALQKVTVLLCVSDYGASDVTKIFTSANSIPRTDKCVAILTHRRKRTNFTQQQIEVLEKVYADTKYPDIYLRERLEALTGLPESRIQVMYKETLKKKKRNKLKCKSVFLLEHFIAANRNFSLTNSRFGSRTDGPNPAAR